LPAHQGWWSHETNCNVEKKRVSPLLSRVQPHSAGGLLRTR
jgi:hypothetical protein